MTKTRPDPARLDPTAPVGPQLARLIRWSIVSNALEPGMRLSESEIGLRYGVSRQPVREVFIKLAEEGLVEVRPQRGTFVRKINIANVLDSRFVREAIEADIVKACARAPAPGLVEELRSQLEAQKRARGDDPAVFVTLDDLFHRTLAEGAGRPSAWGVIDGVKSQLDRVRQLTTARMPVDHLVTQHTAVVEAIDARDPNAAEGAIRHHLQMILSDLPAIREACPQFFEPQDNNPDLSQNRPLRPDPEATQGRKP
ncbi:DNA-binding GntR family transcriptional regulator [Rhodobacter aestuarii]|uniref:DNA-binding transcriptional regulator, GntR family n=1 Tax=Rhodobacter aestuarii TaxID=453582 RepID=A0A1N7IYE5_9RHOB|nr:MULTISPECIES: GntR family transcriptional regulator [Rhodobacter]PTV97402.1 DNA-binding GntR family transcriptional regulator [Rhodobacter aestuarii]SIS42011.1 DNA-binding transcriptional regulator, GntR family [Rhodobacter aestuarii]SOC00313.1 DNA-binding GntR family transcriptional regulator [Rhodobacter sp. JA431]